MSPRLNPARVDRIMKHPRDKEMWGHLMALPYDEREITLLRAMYPDGPARGIGAHDLAMLADLAFLEDELVIELGPAMRSAFERVTFPPDAILHPLPNQRRAVWFDIGTDHDWVFWNGERFAPVDGFYLGLVGRRAPFFHPATPPTMWQLILCAQGASTEEAGVDHVWSFPVPISGSAEEAVAYAKQVFATTKPGDPWPPGTQEQILPVLVERAARVAFNTLFYLNAPEAAVKIVVDDRAAKRKKIKKAKSPRAQRRAQARHWRHSPRRTVKVAPHVEEQVRRARTSASSSGRRSPVTHWVLPFWRTYWIKNRHPDYEHADASRQRSDGARPVQRLVGVDAGGFQRGSATPDREILVIK